MLNKLAAKILNFNKKFTTLFEIDLNEFLSVFFGFKIILKEIFGTKIFY